MTDDENLRRPDSHATISDLGRAYVIYHQRTMKALRPAFLPWVDTAILDAIEARAKADPAGEVAVVHHDLIDRFANAPLAADQTAREAFLELYKKAKALVFPATAAYLRHQHALLELARNHSLASVDLETLQEIDRLRHGDADFAHYVRLLVTKLGPGKATPDVVAYSQFFEIYGEALALLFLRGRGLRAVRVPEEKGNPTPDFKCDLDGVPEFYIEVKSLDIAGGEFRRDEMMRDDIDVTVELERQRAEGRQVAIAEGTIDPFRKLGGDYDPYSLIAVIDTLREKSRRAFKPEQFTRGPTFALAIVDRLLLPHGRNDLAPSYYQPFQSGACVSGVLWHAAYGTIGGPIFRVANFEGKPTLEGRLSTDGLYTDTNQRFPGLGMVVLTREQGERKAWGLQACKENWGDWDSDDVEDVLHTICEAMNDEGNRFASKVSHPDYPNGAPAKH